MNTRTALEARFLVVAYAWVLLLLLATAALGQTVTIGVAEVRSGQTHRQDEVVNLGLGDRVGPVDLRAHAAIRHGEQDFSNTLRPWVTLLAGRSLGPVGGYAGLQFVPYSYGSPSFVFGPRIDLPLGSGVVLTLSHLWRERGMVRTRVTRWTPETAFGLSWRLL